jgi:hypothetical protein
MWISSPVRLRSWRFGRSGSSNWQRFPSQIRKLTPAGNAAVCSETC